LVLEKYSSLILKSFSMARKLSFEEGASINKPPLFYGLNHKYWEARMKIFVESIDQGIWDTIENGPFIPKIKKNGSFIKKPWSQWTNEECKMVKLDCIAQIIIASALDSNEFFRISECKFAKEMWDTLKTTHGNITESKEAKTRSQARRKRRQNRKSLNLCFMAKEEDDVSSVSSSNSSNAENYSQLLQAFQETHEEANRLALLNNRLKGMNNWLENRVKTLEEELEKSKIDFENLEILYKNSSSKCDTLICENCENLEKKVHYLVKTVDKLSKGKSNFENVLASQNCVFGKPGLGFNPQN